MPTRSPPKLSKKIPSPIAYTNLVYRACKSGEPDLDFQAIGESTVDIIDYASYWMAFQLAARSPHRDKLTAEHRADWDRIFANPTENGDCPEGKERDFRDLRQMFAPEYPVSVYVWYQLLPVGSLLPVIVNLEASDKEIIAAIKWLRSEHRKEPKVIGRGKGIQLWGGRFKPEDAVDLYDFVVRDGGKRCDWARRWAKTKNMPFASADQWAKTALRNMRSALASNPLRPLRSAWGGAVRHVEHHMTWTLDLLVQVHRAIVRYQSP